MKKIQGFIDPYSLGFLLSAAIASGALMTNKHQKNDTQVQSIQVEKVQATTAPKKVADAVYNEIEFPFE